MDSSDIGRYGTLSLLKRLQPDSVVACYPIDDPEITVGRDPTCSIRLYYPSVSALHCKIVFNDRKAFLVVLGTNGVLVDGCPVFPAAPNAQGPTTVPLPNGATLDIHKKSFRFAYPPRHLRPALLATPEKPRALRLSMIHSAQVFSPRPSPNPSENLRVLRSPLKTAFQPDIVLVVSDAPRVVEEDRDLIILDEVERVQPQPQQLPLPRPPTFPKTPVRRRPRPSLHREVLIRSAHRIEIQREIQLEEEAEVEETIADIQEEEEELDEQEEEMQLQEGKETKPVSSWRKSLDAVRGSLEWALRAVSMEPKEEEEEQNDISEHEHEFDRDDREHDIEEHENEHEDHEDHQYGGQDDQQYAEMEDEQDEQYEEQTDETNDAEPPSTPPPAPAPLPALGPFMTPQATRSRAQRFSTGGPGTDAGPRRVRLVAPWKVADLVVPALKEEDDDGDVATAALTRRERLTEEERNAIRERRRSALTEPDTFFGGQTPGVRRMASPVKPPTLESHKEEESAEETQVLLARMQQMVEGVRRRQSIGTPARASLSPRKRDGTFSLLAREAGGESLSARLARSALEEEEDRMDVDAEGEEDGESDKENGVVGEPPVTADEDEDDAVEGIEDDLPARLVPHTPPMGDLRHMFSRSREEARATPKFAGLREMFASGSGPQGQGQMQTPQMDGVRAMFLRERAGGAEMPAFEGIGEMLATPVGYRSSVAVAEEERMDIGEQQPEEVQPKQAADHEQPGVLEEAPEEAHEAAPTRTTRGRRTPTPTGTRRPPRSAVSAKEGGPSELQTVAEDVPMPDIAAGESAEPAPGARVVHRTRARTAESDQESTGIPKLTRARNTRARVNHTLEEAPKSQTRSSTRRQNSVEVINVDDAAAAKPPRRTRKAEEPSSLPADETQTPASKPRRRTRAVKTPAAAASTSKTSATRRGTQTKSVEDAEENDDPLDSLTHPSAQDEAVPPPAAKVRRGARSKIPVGTVKQEDIEDSPALSQEAAAAPRAGRSRRTPVPTAASGSGAKSTVRTRAAAAAVAETPARSPSATPVGDKENTPEPQEEEEQTGGALMPGTKVGTRGKATRSAAKAAVRRGTEEPVEKVADGARTRSGKTKVAKS